MNFTESFDEFSSRLSTTDLALYAGIGVILFLLFKDRLSPVQQLVLQVTNYAKSLFAANKPKTETLGSLTLATPVNVPTVTQDTSKEEDLFFRLVVSWKETRDLAVRSGCAEAVKVADQMFPFLSPMVCNNKKDVGVTKNEQTN
jgi:hypothetical protein